MHDRCSNCGLLLLPDQGNLWAYPLALDRALFIFPLIVMIYLRLHVPAITWFSFFAALVFILEVGTLPQRNGMAPGAG